MQNLKTDILTKEIKVVIDYFAIYNYPISAIEVHRYVTVKTDIETIKENLNKLVLAFELYEFNGFYSNNAEIKNQVSERIIMNKRAIKLLEKSKFYSKLLASFPFVEALAISGSLSKSCAKENSDIDFFVITKTNRVWITKSLVQLFKNFLRIFGKEEYMCANYFKASDGIGLEEKSKFTEMELITMLPVYKPKNLKTFFESNHWAFKKYPNLNINLKSDFQVRLSFPLRIIKKSAEMILNLFGNTFDNSLMNLTKKRWTHAHLNQYDSFEDFDKAIKIRKNEIKYHLNGAKRKS